jgi:hypothetical protein
MWGLPQRRTPLSISGIVAGLLGEAGQSPDQQASLMSKAFDLLEEIPD